MRAYEKEKLPEIIQALNRVIIYPKGKAVMQYVFSLSPKAKDPIVISVCNVRDVYKCPLSMQGATRTKVQSSACCHMDCPFKNVFHIIMLWGSHMNPRRMEFGLWPAQQHMSPKHSNDDKMQGGNSFQQPYINLV